MSAHTRLGAGIWDWEPFTQLDAGPQVLWLALYTSVEAKRILPGLFHGSITAMADAAHKPVDETRINLDKLLDADLVEYDIKLRVLRLTQLPDGGESPPNPNVLRGWFRKFLTVPSCQVRDAHVPTIRWMMEQWSRETLKPISVGHEEVWRDTFGRIVVPPPRKRGVRRLAESDTSTAAQPSLFSRAKPVLDVPETVPRLLLPHGEADSVDNSDSLHQMNNFRGPETVSQTVSKPSGSGSGLGSGSRSLIPDPEPPRDPSAHDRLDQLLTLVGDVLGGRWTLSESTPERFMVLDQLMRVPDLDLAVLGRWMRHTGFRMADGRHLLEIPGRLTACWDAAQRWDAAAREHDQLAKERSEQLRAELATIGLRGLVS